MQPDPQATGRGLQRRGVDPAFFPRNFTYAAAPNAYTCPAGKVLPYRTTQQDRLGVGEAVYRARPADSRNCPLRAGCKKDRPRQEAALISFPC